MGMGVLRRHGAALLLLLLLFPASSRALPMVGRPCPPFRAVTTTGQELSLDSFRGQVLLLDVFASWSAPCHSSVPHVVEMSRKYGRQGLQVLGLTVEDEEDLAFRFFVNQQQIGYPVATASQTLQSAFGIRSVPVTLVIDGRGVVRQLFQGFSVETGRSMEHLIRTLLAEQ